MIRALNILAVILIAAFFLIRGVEACLGIEDTPPAFGGRHE